MNNRQKKRWVKRIHMGMFSAAWYLALPHDVALTGYGFSNLRRVMRLAYRMWMK